MARDLRIRGFQHQDPRSLAMQIGASRPELASPSIGALHRATTDKMVTRVGSDCLIMAYVHVAHDVQIGNHVILANSVNVAGHVVIEENVIIEGMVGIQQFVRIGAHAFIAGGSLHFPWLPHCFDVRPNLYLSFQPML